jgi:hypothetical protein
MSASAINLCTKLLMPIVRFCLKRGLKVQEMTEALKHSLVIAAREELQSSGHEANTSKVSALTGIHRRDVMRLGEQPTPKVGSVNLLLKILGLWEQSKKFTNAEGLPKALPFSGQKHSFQDLVSSVSQDLNPSTILSELERLQFVKREADQVVPLNTTFTPSQPTLEEGGRMLAYNIKGLCDAVDYNISERDPVPHLHIATTYDNLSTDSLPTIKKWLLNEGSAFHKKVREFISKYDKDINPKLATKPGGGKVTVGSFGFTEQQSNGGRKA